MQASAIANEIMGAKAKIAYDRIVKCIDRIQEVAKEINAGVDDAYHVFYEQSPSRQKMKEAYIGIVTFIEQNKHRGEFERSIAQLRELLLPLNLTISDVLLTVVDEFRWTVSESRRADFPRTIRDAKFALEEGDVDQIRSWMYAVRQCYEALAQMLGTVAAQVEIYGIRKASERPGEQLPKNSN
jgi:hypothetical protein